MRGDTSVTTTMELTLLKKELVSDDVARLVLASPDGSRLPEWSPGAHIDVHLPNGIVRQYSLCGDRADRQAYEVAVLRENPGRGGSSYVHDELEEQASVTVRGPRNQFPLVDARRYRFIAGGIGITPIVAMVRSVDASGGDWHLVYGGRSRSSMAFRDELEGYADRVELWPEDELGLLDLAAELDPPDPDAVVYCCGPESLLRAVEKRCAEWPNGSLHVERFSPRASEQLESTAFEVELESSGMTLDVPADKTIVEVLEDSGIDVETSCREGTCGTCETAVLGGEPDHRDSILTDEERAQNDTMFICVSRSCSGKLRLDR